MITRLLSALFATVLVSLGGFGSPAPASTRPVDPAQPAPTSVGAPRGLPQPCLVPPVPLKKSLPPRVGGAANLANPFRSPGRQTLSPRSPGAGSPRTVRLLAIRADFTDQPMDSTTVYFNRLLLFLAQYYRDTSAGKVTFEPTLTDVYRMPRTMAYYGVDDSLGERESLFCYDAVQAADPDYNYADYDQVVVFHSGAGQESDVKNDSPEQIWSVFFRQIDFQFYLPRPGAELGIHTADLTAEGDTIYVPSVGIYPETQSQDGYVFSCVGVVCHEMGHALGLPDLYDTTSPAGKVFAESQGIGSFDLMASGTWNANGFVPAEFSAWSKVALGWIDPVVVSRDGTVRLSAVERDRHSGVVKIPLSGDEYFLVENRSQDPNGDGRFNFDEADSTTCSWQRSGTDSTFTCLFDFYRDSYANAEWDKWLPGEGTGSGLLIWHIDDSVIRDNLLFNTVNSDAAHKGVDLEEADGIQDMDFIAVDALSFGGPNDAWRAGNADRFGPDTRPNSQGYYGIDSGITIDQVSAADTAMTFRVSLGGAHGNWPLVTPGRIGANDVVVGELNGDDALEIAVADREGDLYVLHEDGTPAWTGVAAGDAAFAHLDTPVGTPVVADVTGDGIADLLVMADDGRLFGFQGGAFGGGGGGAVRPGGTPLGADSRGLLLTSANPMPGVTLWAQDLDGDGRAEFGFGGALDSGGELSRLEIYGYDGAARVARKRITLSLRGGSGQLPATLLNFPKPGGGSELGLLAAVRGGTPEKPVGTLQLHHIEGITVGTLPAVAPLPDTVFCSAPVVGDIDRDGEPEILVTASNGLLYVFDASIDAEGQPHFSTKAGWPRQALASGDDAISLADLDGNGYPEILTLETGGVLHAFNYNGESRVSLPHLLPSEVRYFYEAQQAPLVADLDNSGTPELVLPLSDGQVLAVRPDGTRYGDWNFFGGGGTGSSPALARLRAGGGISLVVAGDYLDGGRVDLHLIGPNATGAPLWGMVRADAGGTGQLPAAAVGPVDNGAILADVFAMPNPAREATRFHYRVGEGVTAVSLDLLDMLGRPLRRLEGSRDAGVDNNITWDLKTSAGETVAPGVYLGRLEVRAASGTTTRFVKLAVVR